MEILQFLLSFFINELGGEKFKGVFDALKENSFDILSTLKNLSPETLMPIVKDFMAGLNKNNSPTESGGEACALLPIANIADKQIVYSLNKYFCAPV